MPRQRAGSSLTLSEAYHAAQTFLVHIGATPDKVNEPVDGIVEFEGRGYFSRLRYDDEPVIQAAVLGLLKQVEEQDKTPILFTATGFSSSAELVGDRMDVALFSIMPDGDMKARTRSAQNLMTAEPFEPPFADALKDRKTDGTSSIWMAGHGALPDHEWVDCPSCGTTHHPDANFCHRCGASLARKNRVDPTALRRDSPDGADAPDQDATRSRAPAHIVAAGSPGDVATMRCRNCGSHDIESANE